jgi:hypothetical protein
MCFDVGESLRLSAVRCLYRAPRTDEVDAGDVGSATGGTISFADSACARGGDGGPATLNGGCGTLVCCREWSAKEFALLAIVC